MAANRRTDRTRTIANRYAHRAMVQCFKLSREIIPLGWSATYDQILDLRPSPLGLAQLPIWTTRFRWMGVSKDRDHIPECCWKR